MAPDPRKWHFASLVRGSTRHVVTDLNLSRAQSDVRRLVSVVSSSRPIRFRYRARAPISTEREGEARIVPASTARNGVAETPRVCPTVGTCIMRDTECVFSHTSRMRIVLSAGPMSRAGQRNGPRSDVYMRHIGVRPSVPASVPKLGRRSINRQPTPTELPTKNGPEIIDFRPVP